MKGVVKNHMRHMSSEFIKMFFLLRPRLFEPDVLGTDKDAGVVLADTL